MAQAKSFSRSQVSQHSSKQDCWVVVHGKVYDVTKFLEEHPGGEDVLIDASGKDATQEFDDVGHSTAAVSLMDSYLIGAFEKGDGDSDEEEEERAAFNATKTEIKNQSSMGFGELFLPILVLFLALAWYFYGRR